MEGVWVCGYFSTSLLSPEHDRNLRLCLFCHTTTIVYHSYHAKLKYSLQHVATDVLTQMSIRVT